MTEGKCIDGYIKSMKQNNLFLQIDSAVVLPNWSQTSMECMRENSLTLLVWLVAISTVTKLGGNSNGHPLKYSWT